MTVKQLDGKQLSEIEQLKQQLAAAEQKAAEALAEAERARAARATSTVRVIRETLAANINATIAEIAAACKARGVPAKSTSTIKTLRSDFMQTYDALKQHGRIAAQTKK